MRSLFESVSNASKLKNRPFVRATAASSRKSKPHLGLEVNIGEKKTYLGQLDVWTFLQGQHKLSGSKVIVRKIRVPWSNLG